MTMLSTWDDNIGCYRGSYSTSSKMGLRLVRRRNLESMESVSPRGSKYPTFKDSGPTTIQRMVFGTRVLKCWVLGPSGSSLFGGNLQPPITIAPPGVEVHPAGVIHGSCGCPSQLTHESRRRKYVPETELKILEMETPLLRVEASDNTPTPRCEGQTRGS